MAKIIINERQRTLLANYIRENATTQPDEKAIINDILGTITEGNLDSVIAKVKDYAKRGLITSSIIAALLASPSLTNAQKVQIKAVAMTSQSATSPSPTINPNAVASESMMTEWNQYVDWLNSQGLKGSKKLNNIAFSKQMMSQFKQENPNISLDYSNVTLVQQAMRKYRDYVLKDIEAGKSKYSPSDTAKAGNMNTFMSWVNGTGDDGIAGEYTSQFKFPHKFIVRVNSDKLEDQGFAELPARPVN